jgi:uroporphyrinogen decarboxylase
VEPGVSHPADPEPTARFLRACRRLPVDRTPVWFMRQAGRYLPSYRAVRERHSLLEICRQPELAAEVALQPVHQLGVDAAILFADILLPLIPLGVGLSFVQGEGPLIGHPPRTGDEVGRLRWFDPAEELDFVYQAVRWLRGELPPEVPLIGFAGAPFTLACYLIEGGPSRDYARAKAFMYSEPRAWHGLLDKLADTLAAYLQAQVGAGAQAVQLFDSWVGVLGPADYREYVSPHSARVLAAIAETGVPVIHFGTATAGLLPLLREAGGSVIGVDWRVPLDRAWEMVGPAVGLQGNLDPAALFGPPDVIQSQVRRVLQEAGGRLGHIFNLGHGVLPITPVDNVKRVVEWVHRITEKATERT